MILKHINLWIGKIIRHKSLFWQRITIKALILANYINFRKILYSEQKVLDLVFNL